MNSTDYGNFYAQPRTNSDQPDFTYPGQQVDAYSNVHANSSLSQPAAACHAIAGVNPGCCTTRCSTQGGQDYGPNSYVTNISDATFENPYYRRALWTGSHLQLTLMCIGPGQEIGLEMHSDTDQFLRLEQGRGIAMMGNNPNNLSYQQNIDADYAIFIPAGTWHNVMNTGTIPMKLYSIYAPPHHPHGRIHCTKADSDAGE